MIRKLWIGPLVAAATMVGAGAVSAQQCSDSSVNAPSCTVDVKPVTLNPTPAAPAVSPTPVAARQQLPVTGGEVATLVGAGSALIVGGAVLVRRSRGTAPQV